MSHPWATILKRAVSAFGGTLPGKATEQLVAGFYAKHPDATIETIATVAQRYKQGAISSPWGILRAEIQKRLDSPITITSTVTRDRDFAIQQAEQWMRTCGHQFPTWAEVQDELFERGRLKMYPDLDQHMRDLYDNLTQQQEAA